MAGRRPLRRWSEQVEGFLDTIDVFVMTSRYEGMPYAALEAMARGLPIVVADVVGLRDLVKPGINGWSVPEDDYGAFASCVLRLARDRALRFDMSQASRSIVEEQFHIRTMVARIEAVYLSGMYG